MSRILVITNCSGHGGASRMLIWIANQLSDLGHTVCFYNFDKNGTFYELNKEIEYFTGNENSNSGFLYRNTIGNIKKLSSLIKLIKKYKFDAAINFADHAYYSLILSKLFTGIRVVVSQRVDPAYITNTTGKIRLKLLKFADKIVFQTKSAQDFFSDKIQKKSVVIPNPALLKTDEVWEYDKTGNYIVNVARFEVKQKRQDILIKAFAKVHKIYPTLQLHLYGLKMENDFLEINKLISDLALEEFVIYKGVTNNIGSVLSKAKMFVLSSDFEGIPNVILESMAIGLPVVSTDCKPGGAKFLIDTDDKGIIVPRGDVDALANAILFMLDNPEKSQEMGVRAKQSLNRFEEKAIAEKWNSIVADTVI